MVSFLLFVLGLIDVVAGIAITLSSNLIFPEIAKYVGMALILKGVWSIVFSG